MNFILIGTHRLSTIKIGTFTEFQILKMTTLSSDDESCLHLFEQTYATFFLNFLLRVSSPDDCKVK